MLSVLLILGFSAAIHCAHVTTIQDVNGLIDKTIVEIQKEKTLKLPEYPTVVITGLENLKRRGNCIKTAKPGVFECHAISEEAKVTAEGEQEELILHFTFEVVVDSEGHLVSYKTVKTDIALKNPETTYSLGKWLKKEWNNIKKVAEEALHAVIQTKVTNIVTVIATTILG